MGPILSDFICLLFDCDSVRVQNMRAELDKKKDVLVSMESELAKASHWNDQVVAPFHRCDMMLSKFTEQVSHLGDRWRRINGQIDTRHVGSWSYFIISFKNRPYNNVTHCHRCPPYCLYLSRFFFFPRLLDLQSYEPELQRYKQASDSLSEWIEVTRGKQDTLQATKIDGIDTLKEHMDTQKVLLMINQLGFKSFVAVV